MKRPGTLTGEERCSILSRIAGQLTLYVGDELRRSETPRAYAKYRAFIRSFDGAIRHAQRQRDEEEAAAVAAHGPLWVQKIGRGNRVPPAVEVSDL